MAIGNRYLAIDDKTAASEAEIASLQVTRHLDRNESAAILMALANQFARFDMITAMGGIRRLHPRL